jgi:hypothetical protein
MCCPPAATMRQSRPSIAILSRGLGDGMDALRVQRGIDVLQELVGAFLGLHVAAVVDETLDRNPTGKLRHRTEVIAMPVRRDQIIDLHDARVFRRGEDALGVAKGRRAAVAAIDQHRLPRGCGEQRRVAALDVHDVDVERLARLCVRRDERSAEGYEKTEQERLAIAHGVFLRDLGRLHVA